MQKKRRTLIQPLLLKHSHAQFFVSNQSLTGIFVIGIIISDFIWA